MPLLKKFTEEELKTYNTNNKKIPEEKQSFAEKLILEKIKNHTPPQQIIPMSVKKVKNVEIKNVEENAVKTKREGRIGKDAYREVIE